MPGMKKYPLRISVVYFLVASVWIFVSDWSLAQLNSSTITYLQSAKGFLFVTATSIGIYFITCRGYNRITRQELDYKRLFDESPHPILVYDTDTLKVLAANHAFFAKYEYSLQETMELKVTDLCLPQEEMAVLDFIQRVSNKTSSDSGIWKSKNKSGTVFYTAVSSYASTFKGRKVRMMILTDVDEEMKAKQALFSSEKKLQSQLSQLREIAWIQSHELRRPLANIMGLVSLLEMDVHKPEELTENLRLLEQSCNELDDIIKDIVAKSYEVKK
jgi:PAS domain S-box-containing protein